MRLTVNPEGLLMKLTVNIDFVRTGSKMPASIFAGFMVVKVTKHFFTVHYSPPHIFESELAPDLRPDCTSGGCRPLTQGAGHDLP